ncbi:hypothetical protein AAFC00_004672 [Neodothiora populina]|uniref:Uncharacterized protein n=1 Tax=Neodothiora populina TaxID=2781224 RepID=A0ABR3P2S7_9PEZI
MVSTRSQTEGTQPSSARPTSRTGDGSGHQRKWAHTPSNLTIIWLAVSLPLVIWDTVYVFLRPHSMAGGSLQWPLWMPYELYAKVDYIYGWPAYDSHNGFTAAQASLNVVETVGYLAYLWILFNHGEQEKIDGRGAVSRKSIGWLARSQTVCGQYAAWAVLILYGSSIMTLSKTVLYWLNEAFGGFANIGHNDMYSLVVLWIIPNGAWIIVPSYMTYVSGQEILQELTLTSGGGKKYQ